MKQVILITLFYFYMVRLAAEVVFFSPHAHATQTCAATIYLTFDTGNMRYAEFIADLLKQQKLKATFFLANEKTVRGDDALDPGWAPYWKALSQQGHAFGSHTWNHGYFLRDIGLEGVLYRPLFGAQAGKMVKLDPRGVCNELRQVANRFQQMTGQTMDGFWRAPGGHTTAHALSAAKQCGYHHVGWTRAGFLGDELPSEIYPNQMLLKKALREIHNGDILMAHLGIWSRKDPYAPMLEPLIVGLKNKGFCFATLREHPDYR